MSHQDKPHELTNLCNPKTRLAEYSAELRHAIIQWIKDQRFFSKKKQRSDNRSRGETRWWYTTASSYNHSNPQCLVNWGCGLRVLYFLEISTTFTECIRVAIIVLLPIKNNQKVTRSDTRDFSVLMGCRFNPLLWRSHEIPSFSEL